MIKRHIEDKASYRVIAKRLRETTHSRLSSFTVFNAVKRASLSSNLSARGRSAFGRRISRYLYKRDRLGKICFRE
ncbi:MAG: hypothetical protein DRP68_00555 [Candidatus Omnitrophota bacterium]|nr:MAG: hypothetical protein DRP68_00555 [Candidatus Omnitrophota bacterium]